tara:strand:+ start:25230 stop:25796 length:567 start_codon:yes stop_codon:yes gene_type:complete
MVEINSLDNEVGCFAGNAYFGEFFSLSADRCGRIISELVNMGYLDREIIYSFGDKNRTRRVLRVGDGYRRKHRGGHGENTEGGHGENTVYSNTSFSNNTPEGAPRPFKYLQDNYKNRLKKWFIEHPGILNNKDAFINIFNAKVAAEGVPINVNRLFGRMDVLYLNWMRQEKKNNPDPGGAQHWPKKIT